MQSSFHFNVIIGKYDEHKFNDTRPKSLCHYGDKRRGKKEYRGEFRHVWEGMVTML